MMGTVAPLAGPWMLTRRLGAQLAKSGFPSFFQSVGGMGGHDGGICCMDAALLWLIRWAGEGVK